MQKTGDVKVIMYNIFGIQVKELVNKKQIAGHHQILWDGTNTQNQSVSSRIYYQMSDRQIISDQGNGVY
jgi:flagellar hook assembly protein FlgD